MVIRIDALNTTNLPARTHAVPAMKDGVTVQLSVGQIIDLVIAGAPAGLDTLKELADALGGDTNFAATVSTALAGKVSKLGDDLKGNALINVGDGVSDYLTGLTMANNTASPNTKLDLAVGKMKASGKFIKLTAPITLNLGANLAGGGDLDTGALGASLTYHIHAMQKISDGTAKFIASTSAVPIVLANYSYVGVIGCRVTNSSSQLVVGYQTGNEVRIAGATWHNGTTAFSAFSAPPGSAAPIGRSVDLIMYGYAAGNSGGNITLTIDDASQNTLASGFGGKLVVSGGYSTQSGRPRTDSLGRVWQKSTISGAGGSFSSAVYGWCDYTLPRSDGN